MDSSLKKMLPDQKETGIVREKKTVITIRRDFKLCN